MNIKDKRCNLFMNSFLPYLPSASSFEPRGEKSSKWTEGCRKNANENSMYPNKRDKLSIVT